MILFLSKMMEAAYQMPDEPPVVHPKRKLYNQLITGDLLYAYYDLTPGP
jgi:hypothetical protein